MNSGQLSISPIKLVPLDLEVRMKTFEWVSDPSFRELFLIRGAVSWAGHVRYFENLLAESEEGQIEFSWHG